MKPKLRNTPLVQSLARLEQSADKTDKYAGLPPGGLRGTIVDVEDPEERGRVRVVFDDHNPDIPQVTGAGEWSKSREGSDPDKSHWIDTSPAFKGKQPPGLIGKRVNIAASNGQYQYAVLQDVMFDPEMLATDKKGDLKMPDNSSMTRLPCYEVDEMPPPCKENVGCVVVALNSYDDEDWLCVCLKRYGGYAWVSLIDRLHIHDSQRSDSDGDREFTVYDNTHGVTPAGAGPDAEPSLPNSK
jgi:hypothetical protein